MEVVMTIEHILADLKSAYENKNPDMSERTRQLIQDAYLTIIALLGERKGMDDAVFMRELEKRSMSTWSDEELARYSLLTGQTEVKP
jgi:hypothetical protein